MVRIAAAFPPCCSSDALASARARREGSTQLLPGVLTLDAALGFLHEGVFTFQVLLNQLEDAVEAFALSLSASEQPAVKSVLRRCKVSVLQTSSHHVSLLTKGIRML